MTYTHSNGYLGSTSGNISINGYVCSCCGAWLYNGVTHVCHGARSSCCRPYCGSHTCACAKPPCEHCYCQDAGTPSGRTEQHSRCCKCQTILATRFVPKRNK